MGLGAGRPVAPTLEVRRPWKGGGEGAKKKFNNLMPIARISGHLVPFQCNYNERLFDFPKNPEGSTIGD